MTDRIVILGGGAHARVILSALRTQNIHVSACIAKEQPIPPWPDNVEYLGSDDVLHRLPAGETKLVNGVGSTRPSDLRKQLHELAKQLEFQFLSVRHAAAWIDDDVTIEEGAQLMAGVIVQAGSVIGEGAIINTGALIDHDCRIAAHAHVAPGACLGGFVQVGRQAHIGLGAKVIQGIVIGDGALVGAGAVVIHDVPPGNTVVGVPAKPIPRPR